MAMKDWRKSGANNYAKGRDMILNINPKYKVNKRVGYKITLYVYIFNNNYMSLSNPLSNERLLRTTKTRASAVKYANSYMRSH